MKVFPCREVEEVFEGTVYKTKTPYIKEGFLNATTDSKQIEKWWKWKPEALVGVWAGGSNICVLDIDVKRDAEGKIVVDGYESLEKAMDTDWITIPQTYSYTTLRGEGQHHVYSLPENTKNLNGASDYRGYKGIDRRAGGSYVAWTGEVPESRDVFTPCPEWLLDASEVRSLAQFEGTLKDWYDTLEPGEPNIIVRRAIDAAKTRFEGQGNDYTHSDIVERQHEAIRLGAEGNPGVPELIATLEDLVLNREGQHSRDESQWSHEFAESLASGIKKHGDSIDLRKNLPKYTPSMIPSSISTALFTGTPGDNTSFGSLLRELVLVEDDDLRVVSVLWNCPKTRDISHEWGLEFTLKRVREGRISPPPARENPTLPDLNRQDVKSPTGSNQLLTDEQIQIVLDHPTFIDEYLEASHKMKGWCNRDYAIPAAWTALSMAFGFKAFVPKGRGFPLNLWFLTSGPSGSGKTSEFHLLEVALNLLLKQPEETYFNLGAGGSPEAMHEALLERDKQPSMVLHDEASDFFENLQRKDWMSGLKDNFSKWYDGYVPPVNKVRLKELKGKSAQTSFNIMMYATPDRLFKQLDSQMFESGFLARFNYVIAAPLDKGDQRRFLVHRTKFDEEGTPPVAYDIVSSLLMAVRSHKSAKTAMDWTEEAEDTLIRAHMQMDDLAQNRDGYETTGPAITRLGDETIWKCAALLALYRGDRVINEIDAMTAVYYAQTWFDTLFDVMEAMGDGEFARKMDEIETWIRRYPKGVTEPSLYNRFRGFAKFGSKDVREVVDYLLLSGRILVETGDRSKPTKYLVNGG